LDDDRHLEVTAAPTSALMAAPDSMPPRADRKHGPRDEPGPRIEAYPDPDGDVLDRTDRDPDVETGWAARLGRIRRIDRMQVMLALAVVVALVLAGALYLTRRQNDDERAVSAAIARYTAAWNAHDVAAVRAAMFSGGTFAASDNITHEAMLVATWGPELDRALSSLFAANVTLETRGRVLLAGDITRASVVQRFSYTVYGLRVVEDGISQFTLSPAERGPGLKIVQHVWWRPRVPASPSMLWILDAPTR
jgi:hypothetical protein